MGEMETTEIEIDEVEDFHCDSHGGEVDAVDLGLVPYPLLSDEDGMDNFWARACMCTQCGSIQAITTSDPERDRAAQKYIEAIEELGLVDE